MRAWGAPLLPAAPPPAPRAHPKYSSPPVLSPAPAPSPPPTARAESEEDGLSTPKAGGAGRTHTHTSKPQSSRPPALHSQGWAVRLMPAFCLCTRLCGSGLPAEVWRCVRGRLPGTVFGSRGVSTSGGRGRAVGSGFECRTALTAPDVRSLLRAEEGLGREKARLKVRTVLRRGTGIS